MNEKLEKLLTQLKDADIIQEIGDDDTMGSLFVNPIILMPKNDYVKLVIDARFLNSVTDLTNYSWPIEPVQKVYLIFLPNFFIRLMTIHFEPLSKIKQAITYIDDTILQSKNEGERF